MSIALLDRPSGIDHDKYHPWWVWAIKNLDLLLEPRHSFRSGAGKEAGLSKLLYDAQRRYESEDATGAVDLGHTISLVEDLEYLRDRSPSLFKAFRDSLASNLANQYSYLTGVWFEVRTAAILIERGFSFTRPEPPDFMVDVNGSKIGIECHAPRVSVGENIRKRVKSAIEDKGQRKYGGQEWFRGSTVLLLDATWLVRAQGEVVVQGQSAIGNELKVGMLEAAASTRYGIIIALWFGHATGIGADMRTISCVYTPDQIVDPIVLAFRDQLLADFGRKDDIPIRLPDLLK